MINPYVAIAGAVANSAYTAMGASTKAATQQRKLLFADVDRLKNNKLGASEADTASKLGRDQRAIQAQQSQMNADATRQAAASGGMGRSGAYFANQQNIAKQASDTLAAQAATYEQQSSALAANQRAEIIGRLDAQGDRGRQVWNRKGDIAERGAEKFAGMDSSVNDWAGTEQTFDA